jgi:hypothetical protein
MAAQLEMGSKDVAATMVYLLIQYVVYVNLVSRYS